MRELGGLGQGWASFDGVGVALHARDIDDGLTLSHEGDGCVARLNIELGGDADDALASGSAKRGVLGLESQGDLQGRSGGGVGGIDTSVGRLPVNTGMAAASLMVAVDGLYQGQTLLTPDQLQKGIDLCLDPVIVLLGRR